MKHNSRQAHQNTVHYIIEESKYFRKSFKVDPMENK